MRRFDKQKLHLLLTILIMLFIFLQSALPAYLSQQESSLIAQFIADLIKLDVNRVSFFVRKSAHFSEYLALGISLFYTMRDILKRTVYLIPWLIGTVYAITDEIHQYFVPGRSCEVRDMIIDACGVATGIAIMWYISIRQQRGTRS